MIGLLADFSHSASAELSEFHLLLFFFFCVHLRDAGRLILGVRSNVCDVTWHAVID